MVQKLDNKFYETAWSKGNKEKVLASIDPNKYYHIFRNSSQGNFFQSHVPGHKLGTAINSAIEYRLCTAMFVDGICVYTGLVGDEQCKVMEKEIQYKKYLNREALEAVA